MLAGRWIKWIVTGSCCLMLLAGCGTVPQEDSDAYGEGKPIAAEDILQDPSEEISPVVSVGQQELPVVPPPSPDPAETFIPEDES